MATETLLEGQVCYFVVSALKIGVSRGREMVSTDCIVSRDSEPWPKTNTKSLILTYISISHTSFAALLVTGKNNLNVW